MAGMNDDSRHMNAPRRRGAFGGISAGYVPPAPDGGARVAVGMSGGVDSSVTAALLLDAGYDVVGVTCLFEDGPRAQASVDDARAVARRLGIDHAVRDCTADFKRHVIDPFVDAYARGLTPSPCVSCNVSCKVPSLLAAADELGCGVAATGHYARIVRRSGAVGVCVDAVARGESAADSRAAAGAGSTAEGGSAADGLLDGSGWGGVSADAAVAGCAVGVSPAAGARGPENGGRLAAAVAAYAPKDQSYMLSMLTQSQLARLILPLGGIAAGKPEVRRMAADLGLSVASKSDSQDICFIEGSHVDFLAVRGAAGEPGRIVDTFGRELGRHEGLARYTIGQRKGIGIGGAPEPYFVVAKNAAQNELVVGFAREALMDGVHASGMNWQAVAPQAAARAVGSASGDAHAAGASAGTAAGLAGCVSPASAGTASIAPAPVAEGAASLPFTVKLRYRQRAVACRVSAEGGTAQAARIALGSPQPLTAPGQFAVLYDGDAVAGAGMIDRIDRMRG